MVPVSGRIDVGMGLPSSRSNPLPSPSCRLCLSPGSAAGARLGAQEKGGQAEWEEGLRAYVRDFAPGK